MQGSSSAAAAFAAAQLVRLSEASKFRPTAVAARSLMLALNPSCCCHRAMSHPHYALLTCYRCHPLTLPHFAAIHQGVEGASGHLVCQCSQPKATATPQQQAAARAAADGVAAAVAAQRLIPAAGAITSEQQQQQQQVSAMLLAPGIPDLVGPHY
jgi:hypothetical protein